MNRPPHGPYQQPPRQGWPPHPPQPPAKSKAPLVIGILAGVLVLGAAGVAGVLYLGSHGDSGSEKRADRLPAACGNVSEAALAKARTTNPNGRGSSERKLAGGTRTTCAWSQTKGVDGSGLRNTEVIVFQDNENAGDEFERIVAQNMANTQGTPQQKPLDGLGDQATAVLVESKSAFTEMSVVVRADDNVVEVDISGWDAGFFGNDRPDVAELEAAARGLAEEMIAKL
ncbi:hypothetical protein SAMN05216553_102652 [Lentzea fradiae]|uniref:DUF3558 domain-containing protein n=1 Tax=Lentzea fradiae TaxID=200378 RepID=A0A1G7N346_9PSEU|nr:hypothetical protein [Lentzea fradiae]SDF68488.1 hypothetical protein SAMN05216553_102652 [Lentzea fradiae]